MYFKSKFKIKLARIKIDIEIDTLNLK